MLIRFCLSCLVLLFRSAQADLQTFKYYLDTEEAQRVELTAVHGRGVEIIFETTRDNQHVFICFAQLEEFSHVKVYQANKG